MLSVDLNCDMGESFGAWTLGNYAELMDYVSSVNIACGFTVLVFKSHFSNMCPCRLAVKNKISCITYDSPIFSKSYWANDYLFVFMY